MCLDLRTKASTKPYNRSRIRWKIAAKRYSGDLHAPYEGTPYKPKGWMSANVPRGKGYQPMDHGFHVFLSRTAARRLIYNGETRVLLKVEVRGFLRSGWFAIRRSETWRSMRILEVITVKTR